MFARCSNCQTQFALDDRQVGPDGAAVRCSVCGYVFRTRGPEGTEPVPWQIRTVEDQVFTAPDLMTVREWISEGRLHPDDRVSRTGEHWVRLGEMPEFSDAFSGFPDLPSVFSPASADSDDVADGAGPAELGPPPDFRSDEPSDDLDHVEQLQDEDSHSIDVRGLLEAGPAREADAPAALRTEDEVIAARFTGKATPTPSAPRSRPTPIEIAGILSNPAGAETSRPQPVRVAPVTAGRSMLDVATERARSDSAASKGAPGSSAGRDDEPAEVRAQAEPAATTAEARAPAEPAAATAEVLVDAHQRSAWPLVTGLGLLCTAAVVFGVPQVRTRVLALAGVKTADPMQELPELAVARRAIASGDPGALGQAETALRERMTKVDPETLPELELSLVEVLSVRALSSAVWASVDPAAAEQLALDVQDDAERAELLFSQTSLTRLPPLDVERVRARLRLVQGKAPDLILRRYPQDGDPEVRALVRAATLWQSPDAPTPVGAVAGLSALSEPSIIARVVLVLAYHRSGDERAASELAEALGQEYTAHPLVRALDAWLKSADGGEQADEPAVSADAADVAEPPVAASSGADEDAQDAEQPEIVEVQEDDPAPSGGQSGGSDEPTGMGIDKMIDVGCSRIEEGRAKDGIDLLMKALDRRPADVDIAICLGEGHTRLGNWGTALRYYERALQRSPKIGSALRGAARAARRSGATDKAVEYYQRVLEVEPRNTEARAFLDEQSGTSPAKASE